MILERALVDGVVIHDVATVPSLVWLRSAKRSKVARRDVEPRPRAHGSVDRTAFWDAQIWELVGRVNAGSHGATEDKLDELAKLFDVGADHVLTFRRLGRAFEERMTFRAASDLEDDNRNFAATRRWGATLHGPDPRVYDEVATIASYDPTSGGTGTGVTFPLVFPLNFGTPPDSFLNLYNAGSAPTPPIYTITGPVVNPAIYSATLDEIVVATTGLTLAASATAIVNIAARTLSVAGALRPDYVIAATTTWAELPPGPSQMQLQGSTMTGVSRLTAEYRSARL